MSLQLNQVVIAGNCTRDPETRIVGQTTLAKVGIAINQRYKGRDGEMKENTTFVDVEAWAQQAEFLAKNFSKGKAIAVIGELKLETWEDKEGGKRSKLMVKAMKIDFVESVTSAGSRAEPAAQTSAPRTSARPARPVDDEPPF